jgi:hypothetical protein
MLPKIKQLKPNFPSAVGFDRSSTKLAICTGLNTFPALLTTTVYVKSSAKN